VTPAKTPPATPAEVPPLENLSPVVEQLSKDLESAVGREAELQKALTIKETEIKSLSIRASEEQRRADRLLSERNTLVQRWALTVDQLRSSTIAAHKGHSGQPYDKCGDPRCRFANEQWLLLGEGAGYALAASDPESVSVKTPRKPIVDPAIGGAVKAIEQLVADNTPPEEEEVELDVAAAMTETKVLMEDGRPGRVLRIPEGDKDPFGAIPPLPKAMV
jgi:hypothetical protein